MTKLGTTGKLVLRKEEADGKEEMERLNALRNGIAHAFFPENLKRFKPIWKGKNIFTLARIKSMVEDMEKVFEFFERNVAT